MSSHQWLRDTSFIRTTPRCATLSSASIASRSSIMMTTHRIPHWIQSCSVVSLWTCLRKDEVVRRRLRHLAILTCQISALLGALGRLVLRFESVAMSQADCRASCWRNIRWLRWLRTHELRRVTTVTITHQHLLHRSHAFFVHVSAHVCDCVLHERALWMGSSAVGIAKIDPKG